MYSLGSEQIYITGIVDLLCVHVATLKKYVYIYSDLENLMSLASRTSNAIAMRFKIFTLLY